MHDATRTDDGFAAIIQRESGLERTLSARKLSMIAIGGAIPCWRCFDGVADGDDRILRGGEGEELGRGGSPAAVVADFEQGVGAERRGGIGRIRSRSLRCAAG